MRYVFFNILSTLCLEEETNNWNLNQNNIAASHQFILLLYIDVVYYRHIYRDPTNNVGSLQL